MKLFALLVCFLSVVTFVAGAQTWYVHLGLKNKEAPLANVYVPWSGFKEGDMVSDMFALNFFPSEIDVHQGDSIIFVWEGGHHFQPIYFPPTVGPPPLDGTENKWYSPQLPSGLLYDWFDCGDVGFPAFDPPLPPFTGQCPGTYNDRIDRTRVWGPHRMSRVEIGAMNNNHSLVPDSAREYAGAKVLMNGPPGLYVIFDAVFFGDMKMKLDVNVKAPTDSLRWPTQAGIDAVVAVQRAKLEEESAAIHEAMYPKTPTPFFSVPIPMPKIESRT